MRTCLFLALLFVIPNNLVNAQQLENSSDFIQSGVEDGIKLIDAYILPLNRAMMVGMDNTSYTRIHHYEDKKHFNISVRTSFINIPKADRSFDVLNLDLQTVHPEDPNHTIAQTVFGDSTSSITLVSNDTKYDTVNNPFPLPPTIQEVPLFKFNSILGSGYHVMPMPYLNASYRLNRTNIAVGFIPWIKIPKSDMRVVLYSISLQQDLAMIFSFLREKPLSFNLFGGFYHFYAHSNLSVQPEDIEFTVSYTNESTGPYDNQEIKIAYDNIFFGGVVAYNIKSFTFFGLVGYTQGISHIQVLGNYPIYTNDPSNNSSLILKDIVDPMDAQDEYSQLKITAGVQVDLLGSIYVQANATLANYGGFGAVVGFRF